MSIRPRDRFLTFKRDNFTCQYCGGKAPDVALECDHVIARANGGGDELGNYITSCRTCNIGKGTVQVMEHESEPQFRCASCGIAIYLGQDFEGWDNDTFCGKCAAAIVANYERANVQ